jgi:hypothetical protein
MQDINRESRTSIYYGITYVLAMPWSGDKAAAVDFQKALLDNELDFSQTNIQPNLFTLLRREHSNLQVRLESLGPQVSSVQISSTKPEYELEMFVKEAKAVCRAYQQTWQQRDCQVINCNAKIQHLYSCRDHAFKYLWETRLAQEPDDFRCLGNRPVAGGGLRLVMPPYASAGQEPCSIEIRMESFLREPKKLFVETIFVWPRPRLLRKDENFDPKDRLETVEKYAAEEVWAFLVQRKS